MSHGNISPEVVELRDDMRDLAQIQAYLGPYWKVAVSD